MKAEELDLILQAHYAMSEARPILFFDEIQNVEGWEHFARRLANQKYHLYITGSNAKMLSRDIATTLGGRYWTRHVFPFTFKEEIDREGINLDKHWCYSPKTKAAVERAFPSYFTFGGFPDIHSVIAKRLWLNDIFNKIFFADLVVRNKIRNDTALRLTIRRLAESVRQPCAYLRISNLVKSTGVACSPNTVMEYVNTLKDACMLFSLNNYASKFVDRETVKKHYFIDNGLLAIFLNNGETALLENLCAIHLHQHYDNDHLFYYNKNGEVDFYIPEERTAIQACYNMNDPQTTERELRALTKLHVHEPLDKALVITRDEEKTIATDSGLVIQVIPVWKWLLE